MSTMWRRYVAECIGVFALMFCGGTVRAMVGGDTHDLAGVLQVHMTFGFTIAVMVYTFSSISGAHFNPAITLGFAVVHRFPWRYVLPYWLAQFAGAILASALYFVLIPNEAAVAHFAATRPQVGYGQAVVIEAVLTFFLMLVSMAVATDRRVSKVVAGLTVGFTVIVAGLVGNFLTGGSMNPARSLGPALFAGGTALSTYWIYVVGPLLGALLAAGIYELLRGDERSVKDVPEELVLDR
ncbi:MAG: aquaporin [Ktedonobacteraceae bacterium]